MPSESNALAAKILPLQTRAQNLLSALETTELSEEEKAPLRTELTEILEEFIRLTARTSVN